MNRKNLPVWRMLSVLLVAIMTVLAGCGGGGGSSEGGSSPVTAQTGSVAIFIKDGPTDEFEKILVKVTEVSLIPVSGTPIVIYENPAGCEVDLLAYKDEDFLLTIKRNVPAGTYSKVRLQVTNIELVPKVGSDIDIEVKLPSGKIDLNPRSPFTVVPGGTLSVRIDMDANKAIHVHPSRPGWYIFRPVVFVDIESGFPVHICPKIVHGTIESLTKNPQNQTTGFVMTIGDGRGQLTVKLTSDTDIFGPNGNFVDPSALVVGQEVRVRGRMDDSGALVASLVIIGDVVDVVGTANGPVTNGLFLFTPFAGEEFDRTQRSVRIVDGKTLVLVDCGTEVGPEAIQAGMVAQVFGKIVREGQVDVISAVAVILRTKEIKGIISAVAEPGVFTVVLDGGGTTDVLVSGSTPVYLEGDGTVTADYLTPGRRVRVLVDPASSTPPVRAITVFIEGEKVEGAVTSVNTAARTMVVLSSTNVSNTVNVPAGATILDVRNGGHNLVPFSEIEVGDDVVYFGLSTTTPGTYEAPVVLIVD